MGSLEATLELFYAENPKPISDNKPRAAQSLLPGNPTCFRSVTQNHNSRVQRKQEKSSSQVRYTDLLPWKQKIASCIDYLGFKHQILKLVALFTDWRNAWQQAKRTVTQWTVTQKNRKFSFVNSGKRPENKRGWLKLLTLENRRKISHEPLTAGPLPQD